MSDETVLTSTSKLSCLCGTVSEPGTILRAHNFPAESSGMCTCNICRYSTGAMGVTAVALKETPSTKSLEACKTYNATGRATRYFCATCGTHVFITHAHNPNQWYALSGTIDRSDSNSHVSTTSFTRIMGINDTIDGGLARRMYEVSQESPDLVSEMECFANLPIGPGMPLAKAAVIWEKPKASQGAQKEATEDNLEGSCHCGSVKFYLTHPDETRTPDISTLQRFFRSNNTRFLAKLCACRYCRLGAGLPLKPWTYITPENILNSKGELASFGWAKEGYEDWPGLRVYRSSPDTKRGFCNTCGAEVFCEYEDRQRVINVSPSLLRSQRGSLADDFLEWDWSFVTYPEHAHEFSMTESLAGVPYAELLKRS